MSSRSEKGVYFYRFFRYSEEIRRFIELYLKQAKQCGVVLLGKLPNPNEKQLDYYEEIMGKDFRPDKEFVAAAMKRWLAGRRGLINDEHAGFFKTGRKKPGYAAERVYQVYVLALL